jgi:hypothetical protein
MNRLNPALVLIFVCLFSGCTGGWSNPAFKVGVQGNKAGPALKVDVRSDSNENLPIIVKTQGDKALPVEIKLDRIAVCVLIFSAIIAIATAFAAYFVWRAASRVAKK